MAIATERAAPPRIVVMVPCLNEEVTIGKVVDDFRAALPEAEIVVFDNGSTDRTAEVARAHGARVVREKRRGKGFVMDAMFRKLDADYFVLVDGDDTYSAPDVRKLMEPVLAERADMAVGSRLARFDQGSFRALHVVGNRLLTGLVNWIFETGLTDMLSGYRVMTAELVKSVPLLSGGFEVETELTLRTLEHQFVIEEVPLPYYARPAGSHSKLRTFRDGLRVMFSIVNITRSYRPWTFFGVIGLLFGLAGLVTGAVVIQDYMEDQFVDRVPLAILATGCMIIAFLSFAIGTVLNSVNARFRELAHTLRGRAGGSR